MLHLPSEKAYSINSPEGMKKFEYIKQYGTAHATYITAEEIVTGFRRTLEGIESNKDITDEERQYIYEIVLGGFDIVSYLKTHSYEEFIYLIRAHDRCLNHINLNTFDVNSYIIEYRSIEGDAEN